MSIDEMLARYSAQGARSFLTDALGSVIALTREDQSVLTSYAYSPYGQSQTSGAEEGNASQYTARENDGTGLYYYRARYYDAVLKRFVSEDPIGLAGGINAFAYVGGDPVQLTDPLGLQAWGGQQPPSGITGGPWTPKPGDRPGTFQGPKKPKGPRDICRYVPDEKNGGPRGAKDGYWKVSRDGEKFTEWYRKDGASSSPEDAHGHNQKPSGNSPVPSWLKPAGTLGVFIWGMTYSEEAW